MDVLMPQLGETVAEGKISKWFVAAGDAVKPGDNLFEIETDKVSMEVPAIAAGTLAAIHVQAGEVAPVGAVVAIIQGKGETVSPARSSSAHPRESGGPEPRKNWIPACAGMSGSAAPRCRHADGAVPRGALARAQFRPGAACRAARWSTPLARRLAGEAGIDLANLKGSGPHGRIVARDVETARPRSPLRGGARRVGRAGQGALSRRALRGVPLDGMRATIAARLTQARPSRISISR